MHRTLVRSVGWLLLVSIVLIVLFAGDILLGQFKDTENIRESARKFRSESAYLITSTKNIVPSLNHSFKDINEYSDPDSNSRPPRLFKSDRLGNIQTGNREAKGDTKILFLGGSTTENNEVDESARFPSVVERLLREKEVSISILNGGVRGHTTQDSINSLLNRPGYNKTNIVVLMHNINDRLQLAVRGNYDSLLNDASPTSWLTVKRSLLGFIGSLWDYFSYRSNALFILRNNASRFNPWTGERKEVEVNEKNIDLGVNISKETIDLFRQNLKTFVAVARSIRIRPILMTQVLGQRSINHKKFNDAVRNVARELNVKLIDLETKFKSNPDWAFLSDNIHFNNRGSIAAGKIIVESLAKEFSIKYAAEILSVPLKELGPIIRGCRSESDNKFPIAQNTTIKMIKPNGRYPSFSPDGRWILFQQWQNQHNKIFAINITEGKKYSLSPEGSLNNERHPVFFKKQKNGFDFVFGSGFKPGTDHLERLKIRHWPTLKTSDLLNDKKLGGAIASVGFGKVIFPGFKSNESERIPDLYSYDARTGDISAITSTEWEEWRPSIAPNGDIYFIAKKMSNFDLFRLPRGKSIPEVFIGSPADEWDPAISPNGKWVAFSSKKDGKFDIYVAEASNKNNITKITNADGEAWDPTWHPDGNFLAFAARSNDAPSIYGMCLFGQK